MWFDFPLIMLSVCGAAIAYRFTREAILKLDNSERRAYEIVWILVTAVGYATLAGLFMSRLERGAFWKFMIVIGLSLYLATLHATEMRKKIRRRITDISGWIQITIDPSGKNPPSIRDTGITVEAVVADMISAINTRKLIANRPELMDTDIEHVLSYARYMSRYSLAEMFYKEEKERGQPDERWVG